MLSTCNYHPFWNKDDNPRPSKRTKVNNKSTKPTKTTEIFDSSYNISHDLHCSEILTFTGSIINKKISVYRQRYVPPETIYNIIHLPNPSITYKSKYPIKKELSNFKKTDQDNINISSININELTKNHNTILHYIINNNIKKKK